MRRILFCMLSVLLLLAAGCGAPAEESAETAPEAGAQTEPGEAAPTGTLEPTEAPEGLTLELERPVYDPSLTQYVYFVRNNTEETLEFGESYRIQRLSEDAWLDLTPRENWGFTAIGYILEPGGEMALTCTLDMYKEPAEPGLYRLLKDLGGGKTLAAEFALGDSPYTAKTPYGLQPLEDLPQSYGADTAADTDVVFTNDGGRNLEAAEEFLQKVRLQVPCQLRVVQDYGEGAPMVADVIYENGHFTWQLWSGGIISERYFSYAVTDGQDLYLSNGADWASGEKYGDRRTLLIPEDAAGEMISTVEKMTSSRLEGNVTRYKVWSSDGLWDAALTDVSTEFSVSFHNPAGGGWGEVLDVQNWDGLETAVTALAWQEDGTLLLTCETSTGGASKLFFDPQTKRLTTGELCGLPLAEEAVSSPSDR